MARDRQDSPAMDLANMRDNGVRCLLVTCLACNRQASVNVDQMPADLEVPAAAARFRCSVCGSKRIETRPDWLSARQAKG